MLWGALFDGLTGAFAGLGAAGHISVPKAGQEKRAIIGPSPMQQVGEGRKPIPLPPVESCFKGTGHRQRCMTLLSRHPSGLSGFLYRGAGLRRRCMATDVSSVAFRLLQPAAAACSPKGLAGLRPHPRRVPEPPRRGGDQAPGPGRQRPSSWLPMLVPPWASSAPVIITSLRRAFSADLDSSPSRSNSPASPSPHPAPCPWGPGRRVLEHLGLPPRPPSRR